MPRPPEEPNQPHDPIEDEFDDIPLHQKRPFGSGLHKKRITFVPASSSLQTVSDAPTAAAKPPSGSTISDLYLNLVLPPSTPPIIPEQKEGVPKGTAQPPPVPKEKKLLDAKKVRKMYQDDKKRKEGVMRELFGNGKVEKYLGSGAG
ncbi:hypothetical protein B0T21DRAFT_368590 [Apiosordaria backusii]|uniref:Uncharacterized protein n=1 Tax=Apiosordaria backusii TaxID=314023 RepID=A0AA40EDC9_9PEZI|nr:hypothetical protein B0T21DRAFT_368590 [Apiosordaria backusii]